MVGAALAGAAAAVVDDPMNELPELLAALPGVVANLLARHLPDRHGRCRGCTMGGTGIPEAPWPCALHFYATEARRTRRLD